MKQQRAAHRAWARACGHLPALSPCSHSPSGWTANRSFTGPEAASVLTSPTPPNVQCQLEALDGAGDSRACPGPREGVSPDSEPPWHPSPGSVEGLTHRDQVSKGLQHHVVVLSPLCQVQQPPLLPAEVHSHVQEGHWFLQCHTPCISAEGSGSPCWGQKRGWRGHSDRAHCAGMPQLWSFAWKH